MSGLTGYPAREARLSAADAARLRVGAKYQDFVSNAVLMMEGEPAEHVFLLAKGFVKVTSASVSGASKLLAIRGRGQLVGDFGCIDGSRRSGTVVAVTPVAAWRLPADLFLRALRSDAALCFAVLEVTVARVRESDGMTGELGEYSARDRVIRLLARLTMNCLDETPGESVTIPVDQTELAGSAGVARETVCRTLTVLGQRGIAHGRRGRIVVDDVSALLKAAQQTDRK
jgi:CRP/FNR family cyclic AMP-dependent transcriptional regulator